MKILFVHLSYPGQFRSLAPALAARGDEVRALTNIKELDEPQPGVTVTRYQAEQTPSDTIHRWLDAFQYQVMRGETCLEAARLLDAQGFRPDLIIAHPAWGESIFLKDVWPEARLALYCEHYQDISFANAAFDPEFRVIHPANPSLVRMSNLVFDMQFHEAVAGLSPTQWQADMFPERFRSKIEVVHDGVDTGVFRPNDIRVQLSDQLTLTRADEVVTFVNRHFEPMRGCHTFLRALPEILRRRPNAHVLMIGAAKGHAYGRPPKDAPTWLDHFLTEVRPQITDKQWARVHFTGKLPYASYRGLLQLSSVHVYLTYPFVLSWSLTEALSTGCAIVGSDTAPVREAITHGESGRLVDFFDVAGVAREVCDLLADLAERARLGRNARAAAIARYDTKTVCVPKQIAWVDRIAAL